MPDTTTKKLDGTGLQQVWSLIVANFAAKALVSEMKTKLDTVAENAQVNVIESIKLNGTALGIDAKAVNIPLVTADTAGIVISSANENSISYANGIGTVNSLNINKLVQTEGDVLIIDGGKA